MTPPSSEFRGVGRVRSALVSSAIYRVLSQAAGVATYVLLVRIMTEYDYGIYSLFYSVPAVMGAVLSLGIGNALLRFLPEYFAKRDFGLVRHFVSWALRIRLLTNAFFLVLCIVFWDQIAPIFEVQHLRPAFLIFTAIVLTHFQCRILTIMFGANLMQRWSSGLNTGFALAKLVGYYIVSASGVSLEAILVVDLVTYLLWYLALRITYFTKIPRPTEGTQFSTEEKKRVVRYAAFYNFNDVGVVALQTTGDRLFIAAFLNPVAVGAYAFCTGLNAMFRRATPVSFFHGVIEPLIFTLDYPRQADRARRYFQVLVKINYLVRFPIFVLFAAVPAQIIHVVFGGKFIEYQSLLVAAFFFPTLYCFQEPVTIMAQLGERAGIILASKIFAPVKVVAALVLIPLFGVYGAIIATGTAELLKTLFVWFFVRKVASFRGTELFFLVQVGTWAICWATITWVIRDMQNFQALATAVVIVGLFALLGLRFAYFDSQESALIRKLIGNRASRLLEVTGVIKATPTGQQT
jgi:O-antigen/teichoic acid export membrane protein